MSSLWAFSNTERVNFRVAVSLLSKFIAVGKIWCICSIFALAVATVCVLAVFVDFSLFWVAPLSLASSQGRTPISHGPVVGLIEMGFGI